MNSESICSARHINHVCIAVLDIEQTLEFYENLFGVSRSGEIEVAAYHHSSRLGHSCHSSVDVVHVKGHAEHVRKVFKQLQDTPNVDKVSFISAPMRDEDCC